VQQANTSSLNDCISTGAVAPDEYCFSCIIFTLQYTGLASRAVANALAHATTRGSCELAPLHLAAVLFTDANSLGVQLVNKCAVASAGSGNAIALGEVQASIERALKKMPSQDPPPSDIRPNGRFVKVLSAAKKLQTAAKDSHTSIDHLILALYEDADVAAALTAAGLTRQKMDAAIKLMRGTRKITNPNAEATYDALNKYGRDLVKDAEDGKLDPGTQRRDDAPDTEGLHARTSV
jgi:ATP-dependent Clp protease ATP-binding subunit ClpB